MCSPAVLEFFDATFKDFVYGMELQQSSAKIFFALTNSNYPHLQQLHILCAVLVRIFCKFLRVSL